MNWFDPPRRTGPEIAARYIKKLEAAVVAQQQEITQLQTQLRDVLRKLDRAREDLDAGPFGESEATRRRVLQQQALRARLAKHDMSPDARLRTLKAAEASGLRLTDDQRDELWHLELDRD